MKKYVAVNLIANCVYSTCFVIYLNIGSYNMAPWWVTLLTALVPAALTFIATLYISRKSQLNKNIGILKKFSRQLGLNDQKPLVVDISEKFRAISNDIGRNDRPSLTKQHENIQSLLQKEIDTAERRYIEEEKRIRDFTVEQHNMNDTIKDFRLFIDSWQRMASDTNQMQHRINKLEIENSQLKEENRELHIKLNKEEHRDVPDYSPII